MALRLNANQPPWLPRLFQYLLCPRLTRKGLLFRPPYLPRKAAELHLVRSNRLLRPHNGHLSSLRDQWIGLGLQLYFQRTVNFLVSAA